MLKNWQLTIFFALFFCACAPRIIDPTTLRPAPFEIGTNWDLNWTRHNSTEKIYVQFTVVDTKLIEEAHDTLSQQKQFSYSYKIGIKSNRQNFTNTESDGKIVFATPGPAYIYLSLANDKNSNESLYCGFNNISPTEKTAIGISYLSTNSLNENLDKIFYDSLVRKDRSLVGDCSIKIK